MAEQIPLDFDKPWFDSDIILIAENAGDNKLYANKAVLSVFSPVMRAMFTGGFKEANQDSVKIHVDYEIMKKILRIIFHVDHAFSVEKQKTYDSKCLMEVYKAADYLDISSIRKMCLEQFRLRPSTDIALILMELDLHDILMEMLTEKLTNMELEQFLSLNSSRRSFSKKDFVSIFKKVTGYDYSLRQEQPLALVNLQRVSPVIKHPRIDLTKKWFASNVAFLTKHSQGLLHANKGTLASVSRHFRKMFFDEEMHVKEIDGYKMIDPPFIGIDYEYATVKTILSIVHHCVADFGSSTVYHPALVYDMFRVAAKDQLDIPMVQEFCVAKLLQQGGAKSLEVAVKLNWSIQMKLVDRMSCAELITWLTTCDRWLTYRDGDKEVEISPRHVDPILTLNQLRIVINKIRRTFVQPALLHAPVVLSAVGNLNGTGTAMLARKLLDHPSRTRSTTSTIYSQAVHRFLPLTVSNDILYFIDFFVI